MGRRRKLLKKWLSRGSAPEEVQPQASAETPLGVEAESAHPVPDEVRTEPPVEAPEAGVEVPLVAEVSDGGEPQSAAHEPGGVEVHVSVGAAEGVEVQLPPEAPEETRPFSDRILGLLGWIPETKAITVERKKTADGWTERVVFGAASR